MTTRRRHGHDSEEGSVLIMALAFLSLFAVATAALLSFADTAFRSSGSAHRIVQQQYTAEAGVEGAINAIRGDTSIGKAGTSTPCFSLPALVNSTAVSVQCTGRPGSGVSTSGVGGGLVPPNAVLTLPTNAGEGVVLSTGAAPVIRGNVVTNQTVAVPSGSSLTVQGSLTCRALSGTVTVTASYCPASTAPTATDPGYAPPFTSAPALATVPACPAGTTATFLPGRYVSAAALTALMGGSCTGKRFVFSPGSYYFEFADVGSHQWVVNDASAEVVGGTLTASAFPSRCDLAANGVEFVFGGDSQLAVSAGSLELCPPLSAGQRISVYGVAVTTPAITGTAAPVGTTGTNTGTSAFTSPQSGAVVDGTSATVSLCNKCVAVDSLSGFSTTGVPANAVITSATMSITDARTAPRGTAVGRITALDGTFADYPLNPCVQPCAVGTTVETFDVSTYLTTPARVNGLAMTYTATDSPGLGAYSISLDGISFSIGYTIPGITASSGCATTVPYNPSSPTSCAVLKGTGTSKMALKGTVYAPLAAVDLSMTGQLNEVTQRGVIARDLQLGLTAGAGYTGAFLTLPGSSDRQVLFTASIGGIDRLRADATIGDGLGLTPGATVTVSRWSVLR